jgi:hypothetical protein
MPAAVSIPADKWEGRMAFFIYARDGTSRIVLKRDSEEAAEKKARELKDLGWFDVHVEVATTEGSMIRLELRCPPFGPLLNPNEVERRKEQR